MEIFLSKWNKNVSEFCQLCQNRESTFHMLYDCQYIKTLWEEISCILNFKITYKEIVCGFTNYENSKLLKTVNIIITLVTYAIFKVNNKCKFDTSDYSIHNVYFQISNDINSFLRYIKFIGVKEKFYIVKFKDILDSI